MIEKCKALYVKYEEIIVYLIVGVLNTIVSWGVWFLCAYTILDAEIVWQNGLLSILQWVAGVVFGYVMNRKYVFKSHDPRIIKVFIQFSGGRLTTLALDAGMMILLVNYLKVDKIVARILVAVLVMAGNYIISKFLVFKKK